MKTIATFWKPEEAHLLCFRLNGAGIESFIQDENITQIHPWRAAAIGGVRVQVQDCDVEAARRVLSDNKFRAEVESSPCDSGAVPCCACGAPIPQNETRCSGCGWSYNDDLPTEAE